MSSNRTHIFSLRDKNILSQLLVVWKHKTEIFILLIEPDHCLVDMLKYP